MSKTTRIITTAIRIILAIFFAVLIVREAGIFTALVIGLLSLAVEMNSARIKSIENALEKVMDVTEKGFKYIVKAVTNPVGKKEKP